MSSVVETLTAPTFFAEFRLVPVVDLDPHPHNPRRHLGDLTELAASIARQGVLDELVVVAGEQAGRWRIVDGHRRHAAAQVAGLAEVPCKIRADLNDLDQLSLMEATGVHQQNLTAVEQAEAVQTALIDLKFDPAQVRDRFGLSAAQLKARKLIAALPDEVKAAAVDHQMAFDDLDFITRTDSADRAEVEAAAAAADRKKWTKIRVEVTARQERRKKLAAIVKEAQAQGLPVVRTFKAYRDARTQAVARWGAGGFDQVEIPWHHRKPEHLDMCAAEPDQVLAVVSVATVWTQGATDGDHMTQVHTGRFGPVDARLSIWTPKEPSPNPAPTTPDPDTDPSASPDEGPTPAPTSGPGYPGAAREAWEADHAKMLAAEQARKDVESIERKTGVRPVARAAATAARREFLAGLIRTADVEVAHAFAVLGIGSIGDASEISMADLLKLLPAAAAENPEAGEFPEDLALNWVLANPTVGRVLFAFALMTLHWHEITVANEANPGYSDEEGLRDVDEYLGLLVRHGYVLSEVEIEYRALLNVHLDAIAAQDG